ncbi:MAG TPA: NUDIX domain-containing protein [Anaeromyxobacteraceae bacterium]|nr:NUDIX domain-containing protein [Anaeromyxobacteraceae bacterium]
MARVPRTRRSRAADAPWPGAVGGRFERPSVTVDVVLLSAAEGALRTLLVRRTEPPDRGRWALPGGFIRPGEPLEEAAARVLLAKARLAGVFLEQLYTFGAPDRDPRARVFTVAYFALCDFARFATSAGLAPNATAARIEVPWEGETGGPVELLGPDGRRLAPAFDHAEIVGMAVKRLRGKLDYTPVGFQLLPPAFTLLELQQVHETVLGRPLNKDSFRRRMLASGQLEATGQRQQDVEHRPAERYRFGRRSAT